MNSSQYAIFVPVLVHMTLIMALYFSLGVSKVRALKRKQVDMQRRALHADAWPENVQKINNNLLNQFQLPVLFYVLSLMLFVLQATGPLALGAAWVFVLTRLAHSWVHTHGNVVEIRFALFTAGLVSVIFMLGVAAGAVAAYLA